MRSLLPALEAKILVGLRTISIFLVVGSLGTATYLSVDKSRNIWAWIFTAIVGSLPIPSMPQNNMFALRQQGAIRLLTSTCSLSPWQLWTAPSFTDYVTATVDSRYVCPHV